MVGPTWKHSLLQEVTTPHNPYGPLRLIAFNQPLLPPIHGTESLESELESSYHFGVKHTTVESPQTPNGKNAPVRRAFQELKDKFISQMHNCAPRDSRGLASF